jgi:hypothetical protein
MTTTHPKTRIERTLAELSYGLATASREQIEERITELDLDRETVDAALVRITDARRKPTLATYLNRVSIGLAVLSTLGSLAVAVCATLYPSTLGVVLTLGASAGTVVAWQLCD